MHDGKAKVVATAVRLVAVYCSLASALGQTTPAAILEVDVENVVAYRGDIADPSKSATNPNVTPAVASEFSVNVVFGDIVSVNGQPAKGTYVGRPVAIRLTPTPNPGQAIADTTHDSLRSHTFEILKVDGTPVGTLMCFGLDAGPAPPGSFNAFYQSAVLPSDQTRGDYAIVGGTGAFLGARGQLVQRFSGLEPLPPRTASMAEDPANRRTNGGGRIQYFLRVIPMSRPEVATTSTGPAVFHADFSPVTAARPAKAGEVLIVKATGLGPAIPGVDPGQPFPSDPLQAVNSPVDITVNGQPAEVINKIGWPGLVDTYRLDFRVPNGMAAGTAAVQVTAAWIAGAPFSITVQ